MESQIRTLTSNLHRCEDALTAQQTENETLKTKASRLEGSSVDGLSESQLVELENILFVFCRNRSFFFFFFYLFLNMHHEGLRRVSQLRQVHMQKELEVLRKEKEALQEKHLCIVSFFFLYIFIYYYYLKFLPFIYFD
jgi:hypothetical protein